MERREFLRVCTMVAGAAQLGSLGDAWASAEPRLYGRSKLVDVHGAPIRLADLALKTNYVFNYPYAGTPCFLLNLGRPVAAADSILRADGAQLRMDRWRRPRAVGGFVLGDMRAQARLSDARHLVHPFPVGTLADLRRQRHSLLRRP